MAGASAVLSEFFARHPSSMGAADIAGHYRLICEGCGEVLTVVLADPLPTMLDIRCATCGWSEHLGEPAPTFPPA